MVSTRTKFALLLLSTIGTSHALVLAADPVDPVPETASAVSVSGEPLTKEQQELNVIVNDAVKITSRRFLTADVHTPWQIMHGILALRQDFKIKVGEEKVGAIDWLAKGQVFRGMPWVEQNQHGGRFQKFTKPYHFEGHPNQFLAILTMSELPVEFEMKTPSGEGVSIAQMLSNAKMTANDREEITWTLWALGRYIPIDSEWMNEDNEPWSMERLVQIQTYAEPNDGACGGTHGLFALSIARNAYVSSGKPLRGIWMEADQKIRRYIASSKALQNPDGTFSTAYYAGPGHSNEFGKRIASTGHMLEFLMVALSDKQLGEAWVQRAIHSVAKDLIDHRQDAADCGPLYHALHALVLYQQRTGQHVASATEPTPQPRTADSKPESSSPISSGTTTTTTTDSEPSSPQQPVSPDRKTQPVSPRDPQPVPTPNKPQGDAQGGLGTQGGDPNVKTLKQVLEGVPLSQASVERVGIILSLPEEGRIIPVSATVDSARSPESNGPIIHTAPFTTIADHETPKPHTAD